MCGQLVGGQVQFSPTNATEAVAALEAEGLDPTPEAVAERVAELRRAHMRWVLSHRTGKAANR